MRLFITNMMKQQWGGLTVRSEPWPVIDMVDDPSVTSEFFYLTGDSEGHSNVALSNVQVVMVPQNPTNVPQLTVLARKDVVVPSKETWLVKGVITRPRSQYSLNRSAYPLSPL